MPPSFSIGTISNARILLEDQRRVDGFAAAPHEPERHAIARLVARQRLVVDSPSRSAPVPSSVDELIVLGDAGLVERRVPGHETVDAQRAAAGG